MSDDSSLNRSRWYRGNRRVWFVWLVCLAVTIACNEHDKRPRREKACQADIECAGQAVDACFEPACRNGECIARALEDGSPCDDEDSSTVEDECSDRTCAGIIKTCDDEIGPCQTTRKIEATGECQVVAVENDTPCDDEDACTQRDTCLGGSCVGREPRECEALDACHEVGSCDPETGECSSPAAEDGTPCDDGLVCTDSDECTDGECAGTELDCDDGEACSTDRCDEDAGGCTNDTSECSCDEDDECDDGNVCNGDEACNVETHRCERGEPVKCEPAEDACQRNTCDPETGECAPRSASDGTSCDDGSACTRADACRDGACEGSDLVVCSALNQCHQVGTCDPRTGACSNPQKPDESECDDGNACTELDHCAAGVCIGTDPVDCSAEDACHVDGVCNSVTGACSVVAIADGTSCDDANLCTQGDACRGGSCTGQMRTCGAQDACHDAGVCNPSTGVCSNPTKPDGSSCNDGLTCTSGDVCTAGRCGGAQVSCNDGIACTRDSCSEVLLGCTSDPTGCGCETSDDCDDGNSCNGTETCNPSTRQCVSGTPMDCSVLSDACNVGACNPGTGACTRVPRSDGTTCSDGNLCTSADACRAGVCTGTNPITCAASDQCHDAGTCNPATGVCSNPSKANGAGCNDGNACTRTDSCQGGTCVGGNAVTCTASDQCHDAGTCNPGTGACSNPAKANGAACSDSNECTRTDSCQGGSCVGANPVTCTASDTCHFAGTCVSATGMCTNPAKADGSGCSDGNACTQGDSCQSGACSAGTPTTCPTPDQCHDAGTCNTTTGVCSNPAKANGTSCTDGNACTQGDSCQSGACSSGSPVTCPTPDQCHDAGTCNTSTGVCSNPSKPNGTTCSDGSACTQNDSCQSGSCSGTAITCLAADQCHDAGTCNPATGTCSNPNKPDGTTCNDGLTCTTGDTCRAGGCTGTARSCTDGIACTVDSCREPNGCNFDASACGCSVDADCNDQNPCNGVETCNPATLACRSGTPVSCSNLDNACNIGVCSPATGACQAQPRPNGTVCNDGNACTQSDSCQSGTCTGNNPVVCPVPDQCHDIGTCNTATGVCSNPNKQNGTTCNDGNACTRSDSCQGGSCTGTNPVTCTASDQCHDVGTCNTATGVCSNPNKQNGTTCSDGNACTLSDTCQGGSCTAGSSVTCSASDQCHDVGTCNTTTGVCSNPNKPNGTTCSDGNACTLSDTCQGGSCAAGSAVTCSASDQCHDVGTCNNTTGVCSNPSKADGTSCNDGSACTQSDTCRSGVCTGANPVTCTPLGQCFLAGSCNPQSGQCSNPFASSGTSCNDQNACTSGETCDGAGTCNRGMTVVCPPPSNPCKVSSCNTTLGCQESDQPNGTPCDDGSQCTRVDQCSRGSCVGTQRRDNANGDWADDPSGAVGTAGAGPHSIDVFTLPDGSLGTVGTYRGPVGFDGDPPASTLPLPSRDSTGLYFAVYRELGGIATLLNIGGVAGAGTLSVGDAAVDRAGAFTVIGLFTGTASFARRDGSVISITAQTQSVFVAHYDANANITWVWRGSGPTGLTADSVASYDDGSVIAIGAMGPGEQNLTFTDVAGNRMIVAGGSAGVWAARFAPSGTGTWAERAVSQTGVATARGVTTHEDGRATLTGEFLGSASLGPNRELAVSARNANDIDVWFVDLRPLGEFSWGGSLGAVGTDLAGDVARGKTGGTLLVANTLGVDPKAVDSVMSHALASVTPNMLQTHVISIDATGLMQRAALIGDRNGKNRARGYRIEQNAVGVFTLGGTFNSDIGFYGNVGLAGGTPSTPDFTIASVFGGPATLFTADVDEGNDFGWAVQAGGDTSGMTTGVGWDVVMTTHASGSVSLGGMFSTTSIFGDQVPEQLTTTSPGNPFVVHLNSEAEYDYCP